MFGDMSPRQRGNGFIGNDNVIQKITLTVDGLINFPNIPQIYSNLQIIGSVRTTRVSTNDILGVQFNNDTGANYSWIQFNYYGASSNTSSTNTGTYINVGFFGGSSNPAGAFTAVNIVIPNYRNNQINKHCEGYCTQANTSLNQGSVCGGEWRNLGPVTSIVVANGTSVGTTFLKGSECSLYGIL